MQYIHKIAMIIVEMCGSTQPGILTAKARQLLEMSQEEIEALPEPTIPEHKNNRFYNRIEHVINAIRKSSNHSAEIVALELEKQVQTDLSAARTSDADPFPIITVGATKPKAAREFIPNRRLVEQIVEATPDSTTIYSILAMENNPYEKTEVFNVLSDIGLSQEKCTIFCWDLFRLHEKHSIEYFPEESILPNNTDEVMLYLRFPNIGDIDRFEQTERLLNQEDTISDKEDVTPFEIEHEEEEVINVDSLPEPHLQMPYTDFDPKTIMFKNPRSLTHKILQCQKLLNEILEELV